MKKTFFVIGLLLMSSLALAAAIPRYVTVQGRLSDSNDVPISGSYLFNFTIWDDPTAGNLIWTDQFNATVTNGIFNIELGRNKSLTGVPFDNPYYLAVSVNGNLLSPRVNITSSGYAFTAGGIAGNLDMKWYNISNVGTITALNGVFPNSLEVDSNGTNTSAIRLVRTDNSGGGVLDLVYKYNNQSGSNTWQHSIGFTDGGGLWEFKTDYYSGGGYDGNTWLSPQGGNVGVGVPVTTNPAYKLDVAGQVNGQQLCIAGVCQSTWPSGGNGWAVSGNNVYNNTAGVKVGIGTSTPGAKLEVGAASSGLDLNVSGILYINASTGFVGIGRPDPTVRFHVCDGNAMFCGDMGIGTAPDTDGSYRLDVNGNAYFSGWIQKSGGGFLIDDPLDPKNKTLQHSFVESPEMMDIYKGRARTENGEATITMPDWFQSLNGYNQSDYEYSLTPIGNFCQLAVKEEIKNNKFVVMSDKDCEFSWIVYAVRHDAYANDHTPVVEQEKTGNETGKCLYAGACK